ncbi:MAG: ABC transporter permease [Verrucomicrobia bacterium]|nr:ABC transporter permease [Verrucomicrobiota bacterium]
MSWKRWLFGRRELTLALACVAVAVFFQFLSPYFLTTDNLITILRNSVELLLVSLGITFVLATAGIDIAVGGALGICAIFVGWSVQGGWPLVVVVLIGPLVGTGLGLVSAFLIVQGKIPPIIATLGLFGVYRAAIFLLLGGSWISGLPDTLGPAVNTTIAGIPLTAIYILFFYFIGWVVIRWVPLGIAIRATGGNERAARLSGVSIGRTKFFVYGFTGLLVGCAAFLYVARYRNVETSTGGLIALDAIVASVLGGTSVLGGKANLLGAMFGVLLVRLLQNGFVLIGVPSLWEQVITGVLLIGVLILDALAERSHAQGRPRNRGNAPPWLATP